MFILTPCLIDTVIGLLYLTAFRFVNKELMMRTDACEGRTTFASTRPDWHALCVGRPAVLEGDTCQQVGGISAR